MLLQKQNIRAYGYLSSFSSSSSSLLLLFAMDATKREGEKCTPFFFSHALERATPDRHFVISEPQNQATGEFYVVQNRRSTDSKALKLRYVRSGLDHITQISAHPRKDRVPLSVCPCVHVSRPTLSQF